MTSPIIDFHAHVSSSWDCVSELLSAQQRAGISHTVIVSGNMLDTAYLGDFLRGAHPLRDSLPNNEFVLEAASRSDGRLIPFFSIDPNYHDESDLSSAIEDGFLGFKLNPIVHRVDLTSPAVGSLLDALNRLGATLYLHLTLNPSASLEAVTALARTYGSINVIIGHMGFATADMAAINASQVIPNLFLESSIGSMLSYKEMRRRDGFAKLLFGSEFPTHDPQIELAKLGLVFTADELELVTHRNAKALLWPRSSVESRW